MGSTACYRRRQTCIYLYFSHIISRSACVLALILALGVSRFPILSSLASTCILSLLLYIIEGLAARSPLQTILQTIPHHTHLPIQNTLTGTNHTMPSYNLVALTGLSILFAVSGALPHKGPGPFEGPPPHGPHGGPPPGFPTGISGSPVFPTGAFPFPFPTGPIPSGTATNGLPVLPFPTEAADDFTSEKRFEGARVDGPKRPWHHFGPKPPPFVTGGPVPTGTQGPPIIASTGPPLAGPTAW